MKYSTAFAALSAAGLVSAQSLDSVPQCARQCLGPAIKETGCSETDVSCFCKPENREKIVSAGTGCVLQSCGQETALKEVLPAISKVCESASGSTNIILPGTTMPTTGGGATATTSSAAATGTLVSGIPTFRPTASTTMISIPTTRPGTNGTGGTGGTGGNTTSPPPSAAAPKLSGVSGVAMLALAFFAAY
ncbi:hypothetical protein GGTG_06514 [Gaeumannomyces tritici R3-111a-1]|uniref:CFEM domain-containing protein n=1 Tax=Gaeumannomyces tritici (strain R3-111a-1) TaxID=644352 RepID=J3NZ14_GAET3|nr:hypothetical protein GGTG_06514 [Gaeumannomyces tritici R3-111a-1]EJT76597.1 hypothetical protein GGTG_06514 [Gaeumannomyces tritici R3-111a-1]